MSSTTEPSTAAAIQVCVCIVGRSVGRSSRPRFLVRFEAPSRGWAELFFYCRLTALRLAAAHLRRDHRPPCLSGNRRPERHGLDRLFHANGYHLHGRRHLDAGRYGPSRVRDPNHFTTLHPPPNPFHSALTNPSHVPPPPALGHPFVYKSLTYLFISYFSNRGNKDVSKLSLLAVSLQDTSDAMGVTDVRESCSRLRELVRVWDETERRAGGAGASMMDGIVAAHGRLKSDFALAKSWLTRYVETGNVPPDNGSTHGGAAMAGGAVAASADPNSSW